MDDLKQIYEKFVRRRVDISFKLPDNRTYIYHSAYIISLSDVSITFEDSKTGAIKNWPLSQIIQVEVCR